METDKKVTRAYINHLGGRSLFLNSIAQDLWSMCYQAQILLVVVHRPGKVKVRTDRLSHWKKDRTDIQQPRSLLPDRPTVWPTLGRPLRYLGQHSAQPLHVLEAGPIGDRRRYLHVPDEGRKPLLLPSPLMHPSAAPRGASAAGNKNSGRP